MMLVVSLLESLYRSDVGSVDDVSELYVMSSF
jgi:hypothetical protein